MKVPGNVLFGARKQFKLKLFFFSGCTILANEAFDILNMGMILVNPAFYILNIGNNPVPIHHGGLQADLKGGLGGGAPPVKEVSAIPPSTVFHKILALF